MKTTDIKNMLIEIGMSAKLKGTTYIAKAVNLYTTNKKVTGKGGIYSIIAKEFNDTESRVERAIRHAIGSYFEKKGDKFIIGQFRNVLNVSPVWNSKPSNSEFISTMSFALEVYEGETTDCEGMERLIENIRKFIDAGFDDDVFNEFTRESEDLINELNGFIENELSYAAGSE